MRWEKCLWPLLQEFHKLLILLELLHIIVSAAFRKCSNTAGIKTGNPESRPLLCGGKWLVDGGSRRGMCRLVEMMSDYLKIKFKQANLFVCIAVLPAALHAICRALNAAHYPHNKLWAAAFFWLMAVSFQQKLQKVQFFSVFFFQVQFSSLLLSRKRWTKDLQVKVSGVNDCDSLPPFLTSSSQLTAAAVKRAVWMINKDH